MSLFTAIFLAFTNLHCPQLPLNAQTDLKSAYWEAAGHDIVLACTLVAIGQKESQQRVRAWCPQVKQNMDTMGAHNTVLCLELWREGLITDSKYWKHSEQWKTWRSRFQQNPALGTEIASRAFVRLAKKVGISKAAQIWKTGKVGNVNGIAYSMSVKALRDEMLSMYPLLVMGDKRSRRL